MLPCLCERSEKKEKEGEKLEKKRPKEARVRKDVLIDKFLSLYQFGVMGTKEEFTCPAPLLSIHCLH